MNSLASGGQGGSDCQYKILAVSAWSSLGFVIMLLTLVIVGWNQFPENIGLPMEGVVFSSRRWRCSSSDCNGGGALPWCSEKKRVAGDGFGSHLLNRNPDCHDWTGFIVVGRLRSSLRIVFVNMLIKNNGYRRLRSRLSKPCAATASPTIWANAWGLSSISPGKDLAELFGIYKVSTISEHAERGTSEMPPYRSFLLSQKVGKPTLGTVT